MFYKFTDKGLEISIRLTPKASKDAINGIYTDSDGMEYLKFSVTAPAEDNKANTALLEILAKKLRMPKTKFTVIKGATFRNKIILIQGVSPSTESSEGGLLCKLLETNAR